MDNKPIAALSYAISLLALACSDGDSTGVSGSGGTSGTGGSAGVNGSAGASGDGGTGGTGGESIHATAACNQISLYRCTFASDLSSVEDVGLFSTACTNIGGTIIEHCPSAPLLGCCLNPKNKQISCFYEGGPEIVTKESCESKGRIWQTVAP